MRIIFAYMKLVQPDIKYKDSFIAGAKEFFGEDSLRAKDYQKLNFDELQTDFTSYVKKLLSQSKGENLPEGYVPQTTYWLIEGEEFIGRVSIRHTLTDHLLKLGGHIGYDIRPSKRRQGYGKKILELALPRAKELGIEKVLVTCDAGNIGSKKIIEENGGVFENQVKQGEGMPAKLRYWIKIN